MDGQPSKIAETDVNEIRVLMENCSNRATDIYGKIIGLHEDPEVSKNAESKPLAGPIGPEFIERMRDLERTLNDSFSVLSQFC